MIRTKDYPVLIKAVAVVVREFVGQSLIDVGARIKALEDRPLPLNGTDGAPGPQGERGVDGAPGLQGEPGQVPDTWEPRLSALEAKSDDLSPDDLADQFSAQLTKELTALQASMPPRVERRITRNPDGSYTATEETV